MTADGSSSIGENRFPPELAVEKAKKLLRRR
jgi:hypothetical protein